MKPLPEVRERAEELERTSLSTWATLASETKGRDRYEDPDPLRTAFQQDRERLVRTVAFGRLAGRSHVFVPDASGCGWRSRMSQTVATVGLGRAMASTLRLNEDLVEAITTGQALGAPPFGPAGVEALSDVLGYRFDTGEQSLRVVERLEPRLNLTWEVRDGVLHQDVARPAATPEGVTAALARRVAEALYDLDAAQRCDLVHLDDVPSTVRTVLGTCHDDRVRTLLADVATTSTDSPDVTLSQEVDDAVSALESFLDATVRGGEQAMAEHDRAVHCLRSIAIYADMNPAMLGTDGTTEHLVDTLAAATDATLAALFTTTFRPSAPGT